MDEELTQLVWQRAGYCCEYCQLPQAYSTLAFEIDHVIARKHGGPPAPGNLALACFFCNHYKGPNLSGMSPAGSTLIPVRLFHPRRHKWAKHFRYHGAELRGLTPIGRATVAVLAINLPHRVALREFLMQAGLFF